MSKLLHIINHKLAEHVNETETTEIEMEILNRKLKDKKDIELARKLMILKDKLMFHKACSMILQDLLNEGDQNEKE